MLCVYATAEFDCMCMLVGERNEGGAVLECLCWAVVLNWYGQ